METISSEAEITDSGPLRAVVKVIVSMTTDKFYIVESTDLFLIHLYINVYIAISPAYFALDSSE